MKNKTKNKIITERVFNVQVNFIFLFLAVLLGFATNYLTSYLYDWNKQFKFHHLGALLAFVILAGTLYAIYKEIERLDKIK